MDDLPLPAAKSAFDQQPIGNNNRMMIDEYPADFDPSQIQGKAQPLPIAKRLGSKVWKIRKQALQQLLKIVSTENHKQFCEHESVIIKAMSDSNIQCQLISTRILYQYLEKEGSYDGDSKIVIKNVVEKLLTIQKQEIQTLGMNILFWLMDHSFQQMLLNQLNEYILNKNPKIMGASMKAIQTLVNNYGIKKLTGLEIFNKNLKLISDVARPMAKPQTVELYKEIYKWMGDQLFTTFVIHSEVKEEVTKWTKTYQMQPMEIKRGLKKGEQGKKVNPMEEQEENDVPIDILHHFDSRWVDTVLQIQKWQEKKEHLEEFIKKTRVGAIVPRETSHYITLIKRLCSQNNINLLQCGFKIVKNLCKGLKKAFAIPCKSFLSYVYLKLKDNKAMIVDQTLTTLKAMTYSITLDDMQEQIKLGLKDKSPQMRLNTLKLLKQLSAKKQPKTTKNLKSLLQTLISLTNDSASDVRDIALGVLCKIKEHYGMIFFEDKLQSLPAKKVNQIRSTPTIGGVEDNVVTKMEIQEIPMNSMMRSNGPVNEVLNKPSGVMTNNKENKMNPLKKKPQTQSVINAKIGTKLPQPINQKKPSLIPQNIQRKPQKMEIPIQPVQSMQREQKRILRDQRSEEQQIMALRSQEWPIVPTPAHVLRLITLFTKLGEPFTTFATPFKLKIHHFQILQNCSNQFMIVNADLILKWVLWRIQIENSDIVQKLMSVLIHLVFLLKSDISSEHTVLIMSILSSSLESDFSNNDMLRCINTSVVEISQFTREKVFSFWMRTLNESSQNSQFCDRILTLLRTTFQNFEFSCEEICSMARTQAIVKNKRFMSFLQQRYNRELLKVSGFNLQQQKQGQQWVLKQSESQFCTNMSVEQRLHYFEIFKHNSHEAMQQIKKLQESCPQKQLIPLHIKLMDTIMIPYLNQKLQSINIYNYFKLLTARITQMCEPKTNQVEYVTPYLRNLMRLTMFFLIDLSESRLDNKDELTRTVNKIILVFLQKMPAQHLLEVNTMLLNYAIKNNLIKRLSHLLMKCINKSTKGPSFMFKTQKNIKLLFNFFIQLSEEHLNDIQHIIKQIQSLFSELMNNYKELCSQIIIQKLNQFGINGLKCKDIEIMFRKFIGFASKKNDDQKQEQQINKETFPNAPRIDTKVLENLQSMSNLPQQNLNPESSYQQSLGKPSGQIQYQKIREATNIPRKTQNFYSKPQVKVNPVPSNDLIVSEDISGKILQQRRRLQAYQGLCQSYEGLVKMKEEITINNSKLPQGELKVQQKINEEAQI